MTDNRSAPYIGKAEVADMLGLTQPDFVKGLILLSRLGFPAAIETSPSDPRWLRQDVEFWRDAHWDKPTNHHHAKAHEKNSGRPARSPEQTAMLHIARTP